MTKGSGERGTKLPDVFHDRGRTTSYFNGRVSCCHLWIRRSVRDSPHSTYDTFTKCVAISIFATTFERETKESPTKWSVIEDSQKRGFSTEILPRLLFNRLRHRIFSPSLNSSRFRLTGRISMYARLYFITRFRVDTDSLFRCVFFVEIDFCSPVRCIYYFISRSRYSPFFLLFGPLLFLFNQIYVFLRAQAFNTNF